MLYAYASSPLFYTLIGSFLTTLNLHIQILDVFFYWLGVRWDRTCCEELEFLPTYFGILVFFFYYSYFVYSLIPYIYDSSLFPFLHSYVIMYGHLYVVLRWYLFIIDFQIACSGYFRLSVYVWGILLAYIHRQLLSWLHFHVFLEAGRDKMYDPLPPRAMM